MPIVSAMKDLRRFSWNNLAIDVQINVMRFLSVPSIFLLRKLCTASYKASLARSIWTSAIQIDMEYHHIPSFTFPLSSLDRLVLERLAMSPYLFDRLLTGPQNAIPPRHIQILVNQLDETTLAKMSIASLVKGYGSMHLVPGGRFLVTSSQVIMKNDELKTLLQLWDIGVRGHGSRNKIIVSLLLESEEEVPISLAPSLVGNDFYVICDEPGVAIKAYKVANLTSSPTITLLNTFETQVGGRDVESTSLVVSANRVACILGDNYLAIWDFEANTSTILATDLELTSEVSMYLYPHCLQMYGNSLFLTHAGKLFVWNIPELGAAGDSEHGHQPVVVFANLVPDDEEASDEPSVRMIPQSPWVVSPQKDNHMVVVRLNTVSVHRMHYLGSSHQHYSQPPNVIPLRLGSSSDFPTLGPPDVLRDFKELRPWVRDNLVFCESDRNGEVVAYVLQTSEPDCSPQRKSLLFNCEDNVKAADWCPFTGRLCLHLKDYIHIVDFLDDL